MKKNKETSGGRYLYNPAHTEQSGGYAAFSYCERDKEMIRNYIINQKKHHAIKSFQDEYRELLCEWGIDPDQDFFLKDE